MLTTLHVGFKKTGTTSLQKVLLSTLGSDEPKREIWYPIPSDRRPGHAAMADALMRRDTRELDAAKQKAQRHGVSNLVLSSENFEVAYGNRRLDHLKHSLAGRPLHMVVTVTSPIRRFASLWQESVKHGHPLPPLDKSFDEIMSRAGFKSDFIQVYQEALKPEKTSVVIARSGDPTELYENFFRSIDAPAPNEFPDDIANPRSGVVEAEMIRTMSLITAARGIAPAQTARARRILLDLFQSKAWKDAGVTFPLRTPDRFKDALRDLADRMRKELARADEVYGDPDWLMAD